MNEKQNAAQVSVNIFDLIDSICADFRRKWKADKRPRIEDYLLKVPENARSMLFRNLLQLEISHRRRAQQSPESDDYLKRFPQFRKLIRQAFDEYSLASMEAAISTPGENGDDATLSFEFLAANQIGDYELIRELGRGGFGVVYEARHMQRGNRVALKTLPTGNDGQELNAERLHKFRSEFRSLSEVNHPNLVGMQTLEVDGSQWFFTMDLIDGVDFLSYVRPQEQLDEGRLRNCLRQLVEGVICLHQKKILHRDLKPSNVLVADDGRVFILDFGLVTRLEQPTDLTASMRTQHFAGTPRYAAPEQVTGKSSAASDWYALGTMLFEALTGIPPFQGSPTELLIKKREQQAPKITNQRGLPADLAELTDYLLLREPDQRANTDEIASAVSLEKSNTQKLTASLGSSENPESTSSEMSSGTLIGREKQLSSLNQIRKEWTRSGSPSVTWISGLSGEGKSSLADTFLETYRLSDRAVVFSGRCYDRESVPFKVIDSVIDPLVSFLRSRNPEELAGLLPEDIAFLANLFPVLRRVDLIAQHSIRQKLDVDERQIRYRAFAALRSLLTNISRSTPIIMLVDDLQWGDGDSARVMLDLLKTPDAPHVMFLGGFRSDEAEESEFLLGWENLSRSESGVPELHQIAVGPLTESQCIELVAQRTGSEPFQIEEQARTLYERTKGNPYLLEQLVQGFDPEQGLSKPLPMHEIIERKLQALPDNSTQLLDVISISGKALSFVDVEQLVEVNESAFATLTHMRSESLIRLVGSKDDQLVDTYHDKIRETVLVQMPDEKRRRMHLQFGEFLENQEQVDGMQLLASGRLEPETGSDRSQQESYLPIARLFDLAFHFFEAQDSRAFTYQLLAGEQAARSFAFESALDYLQRAETRLDSEANDSIRFRLYERIGFAYSRLNQSEKAFEYYRAALNVAGGPLQAATANLGIGLEQKKLGDVTESMKSFDMALRKVGFEWPKSTLTYLYNILVTALFAFLIPLRWQRTSSKTLASKTAKASEICSAVAMVAFDKSALLLIYNALLGVRMAAKSGDRRLIAFAYSQLGGTSAWTGNTKIVNSCLKQSRKAAPGTEDRELLALQALWEGVAAASLGEHRRAIQTFDRGLDLSLSCGDHYNAGSCAVVRGHSHGIVSPVQIELKQAQQLLAIVKEIDDLRAICWAEFLNAHGHARGGQLIEAHGFMKNVISFIEKDPLVLTESVARSINAFVLIQSSCHAKARFQATRGWKVCEENKMHISYLVRNLPLLMEAIAGPRWTEPLDKKDVPTAKQLCRRSRRFTSYAVVKSPILRTRGRLLFRLNRKPAAIKNIGQALENARKQGAANETARCLLDLAAASGHDQDDRRKEAVQLLREAGAVIPRAESWLLGDQYDETVVAPEFDLEAWEREHGPISPKAGAEK